MLLMSRLSAGEPSRLRKSSNGWKMQIAFSPSRSRRRAGLGNAFDEAMYSSCHCKDD